MSITHKIFLVHWYDYHKLFNVYKHRYLYNAIPKICHWPWLGLLYIRTSASCNTNRINTLFTTILVYRIMWNTIPGLVSKMEATTLVLFLIIILVTAFLLLSKKTNLPPGPWTPIPYIGYAPNIAYALYKDEPLYKYFLKLAQKYGNVFSFTTFGVRVVVLNDYVAIREAFQDTKLCGRSGKLFSKSCK